VAVVMYGTFMIDQIYLASDITALGDKRTRVATYYALSTWEPMANVVERWVKDGITECRSYTGATR